MDGNTAMDFRQASIGVASQNRAMCVLCVILLAAAPELLAPVAWAESSNVESRGSLEEGEITGVGQATLDVKGTTYRLHQKMTLLDDEGWPMEWSQLRPGLIVQYQLKDGALYKIIVIIPR